MPGAPADTGSESSSVAGLLLILPASVQTEMLNNEGMRNNLGFYNISRGSQLEVKNLSTFFLCLK